MAGKWAEDNILIRPANKEDMNVLAEMIQELADFEKFPDAFKISVKDLQRDGFESDLPWFQCNLAIDNSVAGNPVVGYVLYFPSYSREGRSLKVEDLYIRPNYRGKGVGQKLFRSIAKRAKETGCIRVDGHVLEWNAARWIYEKKGAVNLTLSEQWHFYRLTGDALNKAASKF